MINTYIYELVQYGIQSGLVDVADEIYVTNGLLELLGLQEYVKPDKVFEEEGKASRQLQQILDDILDYALEQGILSDDSVTTRDLFDTKLMGVLTPAPSVVRSKFQACMEQSPERATQFYYEFSQATNYIRRDRIVKDEKWVYESQYGLMDITINLSKPEKDPRDIAKMRNVKKSNYPSCLLCVENEGYAGHVNHPARQNHRIIPLSLAGEAYNLQYSPYVYYNEHCIIFNREHTPMKIDASVFVKLLDFVRQFPHYIAGSNADLPIVGGSILSHDHFQGGKYEFAMAKAPYEEEFEMKKYPQVHAGTIKWPMSVIRLQSTSTNMLAQAANDILVEWRDYTDEKAFIYASTGGVPHNTITPIARMRGNLYELDLVLRNNITTAECPYGVYHPSEELHHIKKENIGLIEVMGLAVLPSRLKKEMTMLEEAILEKQDITQIPELESHVEWAMEWMNRQDVTAANVHSVIQEEIGKVFVKVLECAGVYKRTPEGQDAFRRFLDRL